MPDPPPYALFLDSGVLGMLVKQPRKPDVAACRKWLVDCAGAGHDIYIPEIVDYELRRELLRAGFDHSIARLNHLKSELQYVAISTEVMLRAADIWATSRREGKPTSDDKALDGDVILAAQMLSARIAGRRLILATSNSRHLGRFVPCAEWRDINPVE
jgi:predicted nucleic acid-binding protein